MLYHLLFPLAGRWAVFNVFRYITFRSAGAVLTAMLLSLLLGPAFVRALRRLSVGQNIRELGPKAHQVKAGTPTMGGLLILFSTVVPTLLWARLDNPYVWICLLVTLGFGAVGFLDDYRKVRRGRNLGLTARAKLLGQIVVATLAGVAILLLGAHPAEHSALPTPGNQAILTFPFFKHFTPYLGWGYLLVVLLVLVGASNAVNLTDGLDGLAIGATMIAAATYAVFTYVAGNAKAAAYLNIAFVPPAAEVTVFCTALAGASLGFLWFNAHPAEMFMGDVGSLALGGAIGTVAVLCKQELLLVLVGGLFVLEALSVIVQVASFKLTGKRVLRMSPLHHHFELVGWAEPKIIVRFWIVALLFALVSLSTLKLR
ncbi:MAG TPA: phospho-N-acetylmuramoyl-pentapeptide-transferase [Thermoanaerobaculia bacterium]|jgi:phospho-N-acetylmuramoyl-pentapeptide-transferase|nr:phospho-N-acetylmuramoyl-pentapeptide-transferase [Thermoanaerobaculia bacterium]